MSWTKLEAFLAVSGIPNRRTSEIPTTDRHLRPVTAEAVLQSYYVLNKFAIAVVLPKSTFINSTQLNILANGVTYLVV